MTLTPAEQTIFAWELRQRLPKPEGAKYHDLHALTNYASEVLKRSVTHWRSLSKEEARTVMAQCRRDYPQILNPEKEPACLERLK